ncbi:hypothetical protein Gorai_019102 [Gossypium raimondii]|uniref:Uncharacterized protein n=1 Tax=Gossypium raimondii TaxID=29730 RepID=A0A7J8PMQ5_GOSRA|nr:hypothetical protein [Gossypium raimondii]
MAVDLAPAMPVSWRDKVLRKGSERSQVRAKVGSKSLKAIESSSSLVNGSGIINLNDERVPTKSGSMDLGIERVGKAIEKKPINEAGLIVSGLRMQVYRPFWGFKFQLGESVTGGVINNFFTSSSEPSVLDPEKHTTVIFMEIGDPNIINNLGSASLVKRKYLKQGSKGRGFGNKFEHGRNGRKLNRVIRERGDRFKVIGLSRVPLADTMNSMIDLINS